MKTLTLLMLATLAMPLPGDLPRSAHSGPHCQRTAPTPYVTAEDARFTLLAPPRAVM